ncbi:hypothetical protein [Dactylosporangium darangshiense]
MTWMLPAVAALGVVSGCSSTGTSASGASTVGGSQPAAAVEGGTMLAGGVDGSDAPSDGAGVGGGTPRLPSPAGGDGASSPFAAGAAEVVRTAVPVADYHTLFTQAVTAKYRPVWLDGFDVGAAAYFNVVFHPDTGSTTWFEYTEMSAGGYQNRFDTLKGQGFQLTFVESYLNNGQVRYAAIWEKSASAVSAAFHGYSAAAYQSMLDSQTAAGYVPAQVSVVSVGGALSYSGLLVKRSLGASWRLKSTLTDSEYQTLFNETTKAGLGLAYVNAYTVNGSPRFVALFAGSASAPSTARHGLTITAFTSQTATLAKDGYATQAVSGYAVNGSTLLIAYWSK